jgi:O-antigen ligase
MRNQVRLRSLASYPISKSIQYSLYAVAAVIFGWQLGRALTSSLSDLVAPLILMSVCILITLKYPLQGLLLAFVLHPFVTFIYLYIKLPGAPALTIGRAVVLVIFVLILARGATRRRPFLPLTWMDVFMLLSVTGLSIAALRGESRSYIQWVGDMYLIPYLIYYIVKYLVTGRRALKQVLWTVAIIGAYCGVYGIYTQTTGNILFVGPDFDGYVWYSQSLRIMRGLLDSPHTFGLVFSLAIPIQFYLLIKAHTLDTKILTALMLAVTLGGLFFTYKRTAWIATVGSLLVIQFFFPRFRRLFLVLAALAAGIMLLYSNEINDSAVATERVGDNTDTLNGRTGLWEVAWKGWQQEPIWGYGLGQFVARSSVQVESTYLWLLVDSGLVGFMPFVLVFILLLKNSIRVYRARAPSIFVEPDLVAVFWGSFAAYLISFSTVVMNHELPYMLFFLLAGAVVGSQEAILDQQSNHQPKAIPARGGDLGLQNA